MKFMEQKNILFCVTERRKSSRREIVLLAIGKMKKMNKEGFYRNCKAIAIQLIARKQGKQGTDTENKLPTTTEKQLQFHNIPFYNFIPFTFLFYAKQQIYESLILNYSF